MADFADSSIKLSLYAKQFGFRNTLSTNHALISITEEIRRVLDTDNLHVEYS